MPPTRVTSFVGGALVSVLTMVVMLATEPGLAIVWDEGYTLGRQERLRLWSRAVRDPQGFSATWKARRFHQRSSKAKGMKKALRGQSSFSAS